MKNLIRIDGFIFASTVWDELVQEATAYYKSKGFSTPVLSMEGGGDFLSVVLNIPTMFNSVAKALSIIGDICNHRQFEEAIPMLKDVIQKCPWSVEAYRILAQIEFGKDHLDEAEEICKEALRFKSGDYASNLLMGNILRAKKMYDKCLEFYLLAEKADPNDALVISNIAVTYGTLGNYPRAIVYFEKAISYDSTSIGAYYGLAHVFSMQNKQNLAFSSAIAGLKRGKEAPQNPPVIPHLLNVAVDSATKLVETTNNQLLVRNITNSIKKVDKRSISFIKDESISCTSKLEYASQHDTNKHIIKYKQGILAKSYILVHELVHLHMMVDDEQAGLLKTIILTDDNYKSFLKDTSLNIKNISRYIGSSEAEQLSRNLFDGLVLQLFNCPIDLIVDRKIYDHESMRPLQFLHIFNELKEICEKLPRLNNPISKLIPEKVRFISVTLNIVSALQLKELYGVDLRKSFDATSKQLDMAYNLYASYKRCYSKYKPGDEFTLLNEFADMLKAKSYYSIQPMKPTESGDVHSYLTDEERKRQEKFDEEFSGNKQDDRMSMHMLKALCHFAGMPVEEVRTIAFQIAMLGIGGISPTKDGYTVSGIPNKSFSGYELLAYYYVSWKIAEPDKLSMLGLPFDDAYKEAEAMFKRN